MSCFYHTGQRWPVYDPDVDMIAPIYPQKNGFTNKAGGGTLRSILLGAAKLPKKWYKAA